MFFVHSPSNLILLPRSVSVSKPYPTVFRTKQDDDRGVIGAGEWCDGCGVLITFGSRGHSVVRCGDIDRIGRDSS